MPRDRRRERSLNNFTFTCRSIDSSRDLSWIERGKNSITRHSSTLSKCRNLLSLSNASCHEGQPVFVFFVLVQCDALPIFPSLTRAHAMGIDSENEKV